MIDLIVVRGDGDRDGGEIFDPLLSSTEVAIARGTQQINASTPVNTVTLQSIFRTGVRVGQLVEVLDAMQGETWRGIVMGLSHVVEGPTIYTQLEIEREAWMDVSTEEAPAGPAIVVGSSYADAYTIKGRVSSDLADAYGMAGKTASNFADSYTIRARVAASFTDSYTIGLKVGSNFTDSYSMKGRIGNNYSDSFAVAQAYRVQLSFAEFAREPL